MKRGVIVLTKEELSALILKFPITKVIGTPLAMKLDSAIEQIETPIKIEVSEDEIETILDEVGLQDSTDNDALISARMKFREILLVMRKGE